MTHSGGKPHAVGDRGQRYEVSFNDGDEMKILGWTDDYNKASAMCDAVDKHPIWKQPRIKNRHEPV